MNLNIASGGSVSVSEVAFGRDFNEALVHQVVTAFMAGSRQGTKGQKTRSEVSGGGKKPWKQKGSGRARAGTIRSPIWRGGGKVFAASTRDHSQKVNKKMYRGAMQCILSELIRQDRVVVVDQFAMENPKTKELIQKLKGLGLDSALIVSDFVDENLFLSARNVVNVGVCDVDAIDPVSLIAFEKVVVTVGALRKFEEMLG